VLRVVAGRVRGAAKAEWGSRKIGAACNALANKSVESGVPRRVAPRPYGKARPEGPSRRGTVFILRPAGPKVEARRGEILGVVNMWGHGSELDSGSAQVIMPKGFFLRNQHVTLPSIVRLRDFPSHRTVLPPCRMPIPCIIA